MSLLRRRIRKEAMTQLYLRPGNVKSHVNGSITFAVRAGSTVYGEQIARPEDLCRVLEDFFHRNGREDMVPVRFGYRGSVAYATYSNMALVDEAEGRYGIHTMRSYVTAATLSRIDGAGEMPVASEVNAAMEGEEFDFNSVPEIEGLALEGSEA